MVFFRGWINLEYLVLLGIAFLFPSWWTITLLTVEMCIALVEPIASLYYISPRDTLPSIRYLLLLPAPRLIEYGCLLIVYAISVAVALRATLGRYRRKDAKYMVALAWPAACLRYRPICCLGASADFISESGWAMSMCAKCLLRVHRQDRFGLKISSDGMPESAVRYRRSC